MAGMYAGTLLPHGRVFSDVSQKAWRTPSTIRPPRARPSVANTSRSGATIVPQTTAPDAVETVGVGLTKTKEQPAADIAGRARASRWLCFRAIGTPPKSTASSPNRPRRPRARERCRRSPSCAASAHGKPQAEGTDSALSTPGATAARQRAGDGAAPRLRRELVQGIRPPEGQGGADHRRRQRDRSRRRTRVRARRGGHRDRVLERARGRARDPAGGRGLGPGVPSEPRQPRLRGDQGSDRRLHQGPRQETDGAASRRELRRTRAGVDAPRGLFVQEGEERAIRQGISDGAAGAARGAGTLLRLSRLGRIALRGGRSARGNRGKAARLITCTGPLILLDRRSLPGIFSDGSSCSAPQIRTPPDQGGVPARARFGATGVEEETMMTETIEPSTPTPTAPIPVGADATGMQQAMQPAQGITMRQLLEAGVHFGHQTKRWNPKMKPYIFGARNGIYIVDLQKTVKLAREAFKFVSDVCSRGGSVLFVG